MSGFTPGPWLAAAKYSSVVGLPVVQQGRGRSIASVTFFNLGEGFENHDRESYANARLIAAAPRLYAALKTALLLMELQWGDDASDNSAIGEARAALAEARGADAHTPDPSNERESGQ